MTKVVVQNGNVDLALKSLKQNLLVVASLQNLRRENAMKNQALKEEMKRKKTLKIHAVETITKEAIYGKSN